MLRSANPNDAIYIAQIHILARSKAMPWLPVIHSPEDVLAFFSKKVLCREDVLVVEDGGKIAGFVAFSGEWLNHLYIHPEHWGKGFGSMLLSEAMAHSQHLQLWTFQRNTGARAFYTRHGFVEAQFTDGARNEEKEPDIRLIWDRPLA